MAEAAAPKRPRDSLGRHQRDAACLRTPSESQENHLGCVLFIRLSWPIAELLFSVTSIGTRIVPQFSCLAAHSSMLIRQDGLLCIQSGIDFPIALRLRLQFLAHFLLGQTSESVWERRRMLRAASVRLFQSDAVWRVQFNVVRSYLWNWYREHVKQNMTILGQATQAAGYGFRRNEMTPKGRAVGRPKLKWGNRKHRNDNETKPKWEKKEKIKRGDDLILTFTAA